MYKLNLTLNNKGQYLRADIYGVGGGCLVDAIKILPNGPNQDCNNQQEQSSTWTVRNVSAALALKLPTSTRLL